MAETFDLTTLTEVLRPQLAASALHLTPIRTGKHNTSYWVDTNQGRFVLRLAPPDDAGFLFYDMRCRSICRSTSGGRTTEPARRGISSRAWRWRRS